MGSKLLTDESIVSALISNGTVKAAANSLGISERTIYNRLNDGEFCALYKEAKADIIRATVISINNKLQAAVSTINEIMLNENINAAVRLQAAQTLLNNAGKFSQRLQVEEQDLAAQIDSNMWGI